MAENGESSLNTSQPELLHMLWNLPVCCLSLMRKAVHRFSYFNFSPVFSVVGGRGMHSRLRLWVLPSASLSSGQVCKVSLCLGAPGWVVCAWAVCNPVLAICLWSDNTDGDCPRWSFSVSSGFACCVMLLRKFMQHGPIFISAYCHFSQGRMRSRRKGEG